MRKIIFLILLLVFVPLLGNAAGAQNAFIPTHFLIGSITAENQAVLNQAENQPVYINFGDKPAAGIKDLIGSGKAQKPHHFMFNTYEIPPLCSWKGGNAVTIFVPTFEVGNETYAGILTASPETLSGVEVLKNPLFLVKASSFLPEENPVIQVSNPGPLVFVIEKNNPNSGIESLTITNIGKGTLNPNIAVKPESSWLELPTSGPALKNNQSWTVKIAANASGLLAGIYPGELIISDPEKPLVPSITIKVNLIVSDTSNLKPVIGLDPTSLSFTATEKEPPPPPQTILISNIGNGTLKPRATKSQDWLLVNIPDTSINEKQFIQPAIAVNTSGLKAGLYQDLLLIADKDNPSEIATKECSVALMVLQKDKDAAPKLAVGLNAPSLSFNMTEDGALPPPQKLTIANVGKGILEFKIDIPEPWLTASVLSGQLASGEQKEILVSINSQPDPGKYDSNLVIYNKNVPSESIAVKVSLVVTGSNPDLPLIDISANEIMLTGESKSNIVPSQNLEVTNVGGGILNPLLAKENNAGWLSWLYSNDGLGGGKSTLVTISCDPQLLAAGIYTETVKVSDLADNNISAKECKVTFVVQDSSTQNPILGINPAFLEFKAVAGANPPPEQKILIFNLGGGKLNYEIQKPKDANWLSLSENSGEVPALSNHEITIAAKPAGLPIGNYLSTLEVKDKNNLQNTKMLGVLLSITPPVVNAKGKITNLSIKRLGDAPGDNLQIDWETQPLGLVTDLYILEGTFNEGKEGWKKIAAGQVNNQYLLENQVGKAPDELYVKVVPSGIAENQLKDFSTVGKFNIKVSGGGKYSLIATPFIHQPTNTLNDVIGKQLNQGTLDKAHLIFGWDGTGFSYGMYIGNQGWTVIPNNISFNMERGKGFFVYSQPTHTDKTVTLAGKVSTATFETSLNPGYNLIGNPSPVSVPLDEAGFDLSGANKGMLSSADLIFGWDGTGYSLGGALSNQGWTAIPGNNLPSFEKGKGYFYYINPINQGFKWKSNL